MEVGQFHEWRAYLHELSKRQFTGQNPKKFRCLKKRIEELHQARGFLEKRRVSSTRR